MPGCTGLTRNNCGTAAKLAHNPSLSWSTLFSRNRNIKPHI